MPELEDRKMYCQSTCENCRYSIEADIDNDEGSYDKHSGYVQLFCMLGVSQEDAEYATDEAADNYYGKNRGDWHPYTKRFIEIMKISKSGDLVDSPRTVSKSSCCQFYERVANGNY